MLKTQKGKRHSTTLQTANVRQTKANCRHQCNSKGFSRKMVSGRAEFKVHKAPLGVTLPAPIREWDAAHGRGRPTQPGVYHHLQPFITLSRCLGLMPLTAGDNSSTVVFRWLCLPTLLTFLLTCCMAATGLAASKYYLSTPAPKWGIEAVAVHPQKMIFYLVTPSVLLLSLLLARALPELIRQWDEAVVVLAKPMYSRQGPIHMSRARVALVSGVFGALALTEHVLHDISLGTCLDGDVANDQEDHGFLQCYFLGTPFVSTYFRYSDGLALVIVIVEKFAMLAWNFPSLLVILFSLSLDANFRVIAKHVQKKVTASARGGRVSEWKEVREDHLVLCRLLRLLDNAISPLTLMAFLINIYWNCVQAYSSLRPKARLGLEIVYFWTSFLLLTVRLGGVSLAGTLLYEQANKPLRDLFYCHPNSYSEEVVRFQTHITGQTLGLTGMKFFVVNRQLLLTIISLILTYELILLDSR